MSKVDWSPDRLAKSYFEKFVVRAEVLREYHKRKAYSDVIREGQEALELAIKGMLRSLGIEPTFTHDPGKELAKVLDRLPAGLKKLGPNLVRWSKNLRRERELAYYGAADFIPTEEYEESDALEVIEFLDGVSECIQKLIVV